MKVEIKFLKNEDRENLREIIENETDTFLKEKGINHEAVVSFIFVSESEIKDLNQKYRKIDQPTDVLSFPIWENEAAIPKKGIVNLGDVFIFENRVLENAKQSNKSFEEELRFIVHHCLNHLIGKHH
ncbi:MAG: rRNA maturation RNase YbeY [Patescibacteria group bacterium]